MPFLPPNQQRQSTEGKLTVSYFSKIQIGFTLLVPAHLAQARKLNKEDAMDRCKWRKMIKEAR